jgi:hypothetical protein
MKIESPEFTQAELDRFFDEQLDRERVRLAERIESASARLAAIAPRISSTSGGGDQWSNHEVLAHIAVLSKFYGVMVHRVTSGQMTEVDLLDATKLRDVAGEQTAALPTADIMRSIAADHARTANLLRSMDPTALRKTARLPSGETVSAEFLVRYPLVNHLEQHVEQLERALL